MLVVTGGAARAAEPASPDPKAVAFFESKIRPVLVENCYACHSTKSQKVKAGLLLDSRSAMLKGGDSGPAIVVGKPDDSLLIKGLKHDAQLDLKMPPKKRLPDAVVADFAAWVKQGAPWPADAQAEASAAKADELNPDRARREHWAYQPLAKPPVPKVAGATSPIDAFVLAKLAEKKLKPSPPADKRTLVRRVYLDLIGLPPTPDEVAKFLADESPSALERVVDDLLARPQYGERWGRHWLDVARYAETQGYERDEPKPFTWKYRDWVIKAFNDDKPYDRFVVEQIAGDEVERPDADSQVATTFLRVGTFDTIAADGKLARYDHLDDVVGTVSAAFLGQTLRCARCHNHKFEPYSQADYYKVLSVFDPLEVKARETVQVGSPEQRRAADAEVAAFERTIAPLAGKQVALRLKVLERAGAGYYSEAAKDKAKRDDARARVPSELLAAYRVPAADRTKEQRELVDRNLNKLTGEFQKFASKDEKDEDAALQKQLDAANQNRPKGLQAYAVTEAPVGKNAQTRLFLRGDPNKPGPEVPVALPTLWSPEPVPGPKPREKTSGRRIWLADWVVTGGKPLAARVMANRLWQYHFGRGIVATPNDLGLKGDPPSHPELLNYLAAELVDGGWRLKRVHKLIVLSSTYQQSADFASVPDADPDNALLWRFPSRRLESEAIRDSMLAVSGKLNLEAGGPSVYPPLAQQVVGDSSKSDWATSDERQASRRTVYVFQKRSIPLPEMEVLGIPDSTTSIDVRPNATTALQSLMLMNSRFAADQAAALAERVKREAGDDARAQVQRAFEVVLCRPATTDEVEAAAAYVAAPSDPKQKLTPLASFCQVLLNTNEFLYLR
ncbi:MAG TPA: PSD1 and planctomycete cytochrome C domain-containing protein [Humisphaera sp.]